MDFRKIINIVSESSAASGKKIDRWAFLYLEPKKDIENFAQCSTCVSFMPDKQRCSFFGSNDKVLATASCGLYVQGKPSNDQKFLNSVTPAEAGYVNEAVRCENCKYGGDDCILFEKLNESLPTIFKIDTKIKKKGCCNAWEKYEK